MRIRNLLLLVLVVSTIIITRVLNLSADPPMSLVEDVYTRGEALSDEGYWTHNARNNVLFGGWSVDSFNPMYISPITTLFFYIFYSVFGVGFIQSRIVSGFFFHY